MKQVLVLKTIIGLVEIHSEVMICSLLEFACGIRANKMTAIFEIWYQKKLSSYGV